MKLRGRVVLLSVGVLIVARFFAAGLLPLSADEAYYWLWSRHLAWGYYDHPPLIAFAVRAGTAVFGETAFGVRLMGLLASVLASVAVWRAAAILLQNEKAGGYACLFFNISLMVAIETMAATPDALAVATTAFFLFGLAKVERTGRGGWWLFAGFAAGIGLLAKYTSFFLGVGALVWLLADKQQRRWLFTPWPYLGGLLAAVVFLPNLWWNATHDWQTFAFQFGRLGEGHFTLRFLAELLGSQLGLATPFLFVLAVMGIMRRVGHSLLVPAFVWPSIAYFLLHALHDRVQGNWPSFLYPPLAIAAADAAMRTDWKGWAEKLIVFSRSWAIPVAAVLLGLLYLQALTGIVPLGRKDPMQRLLGFGLVDMSKDIVREVSARRAGAILTTDYAMTAWLRFYLPADLPVIQLGEDWRWEKAPPPRAEVFRHPLIYIANVRRDRTDLVKRDFASVVPCTRLTRSRWRTVIDEYAAYCVVRPRVPAPGRVP